MKMDCTSKKIFNKIYKLPIGSLLNYSHTKYLNQLTKNFQDTRVRDGILLWPDAAPGPLHKQITFTIILSSLGEGKMDSEKVMNPTATTMIKLR